jgi:polysaccharide chain length determinant protein (PEP-CTERM system associated)
MSDPIVEAVSSVRGARRFIWPAVIAAWAVAGLGWFAVSLIPDIFEAHAKVYLDTDTVLRPLLRDLAVGTDEAGQLNLMANVLRSRPTLERVIRDTPLQERVKTQSDRETMIDGLSKRIVIDPGMRNVYTITFADGDPKTAAAVVQAVLTTLVDNMMGSKRSDSVNAMEFLQQQIKEYDDRLRTAEEKLAQFKREHIGMLPGEGGDYYTRLQAEMANLEKLRSDYQLAVQKKTELGRQLDGEEPTFGLFTTTKSNSPVDARIAELKAKVDTLLLQFTEKHPDVIALRQTIAQLEEQKKHEKSAGDKAPALGAPLDISAGPGTAAQKAAMRTLDINPIYQSTKVALGQVDLDIVELKTQIASAEARERDLRSKVGTIPGVEAQLARLNRDYEVNRAQRTQLLQRLESARLSDEAQQTAGDSKFKIVEKPVVPARAAAPNRPLLVSAVLVLALVAGIAMAVGLNIVFPVVATRDSLKRLTGIETLGSISLVQSHAWYRGPLLVAASGLGLLVFVYTLILSAAAAGVLRI